SLYIALSTLTLWSRGQSSLFSRFTFCTLSRLGLTTAGPDLDVFGRMDASPSSSKWWTLKCREGGILKRNYTVAQDRPLHTPLAALPHSTSPELCPDFEPSIFFQMFQRLGCGIHLIVILAPGESGTLANVFIKPRGGAREQHPAILKFCRLGVET